MEKILLQLTQILAYAGMVQGVFVALLLNSRSFRKSKANLFLSLLLIAMSFSIVHMMFAGKIMEHFSLEVVHLGDPTFLLIAPFLWLYARVLTGENVGSLLNLLKHFLPFLLIIAASILLRFIVVDTQIIQQIAVHQHWVYGCFWFIVVVQFSSYLYSIHKKLNAHEQRMVQEVSNTENVNISWVRYFMSIFLFINFFFLISFFTVIHQGDMMWLGRFTLLVFSFSIFALGYRGILQREIFFTDLQPATIPAATPLEVPLTKKPDQEQIDRLLHFMEEKKPYLDPELTLSSLAKELAMSRSTLSQLINDSLGENFYNFINKYRVEQVKKFMQDESMKNYSLLGLALEAGFKSKSTFNLIFKRFTGLTPSEYIKNTTQ